MWNFLKECEDSGFYVTVDHIAISNEKTEGPRLTGDMQINFYSLVSSDRLKMLPETEVCHETIFQQT